MKKNQEEKRVAIALATGLIVSTFPVDLTYAKTNIDDKLNSELELNIKKNIIDDNNIKTDSNSKADKITAQEVSTVTLKDGKQIRAVKDENGEITLQEFDKTNNSWIDKCKIGKVEIKEMKETDDGGYTVIYLDYKKADDFKYKQAYDKNSNKIGTEEIVGIEILTEHFDTISLDLAVDKNNNKTTIKSLLETVTVKEFYPTLCGYIGSKHIFIIGKDSKGNTSSLIVTANGKVINGDIIKDSNYISSEYTEVRSLGISDIEDEKFIISGYAVKGTDPNKKDGFLIQFDKYGNKNSKIKIIPNSYSKNGNASINTVVKFNSGNILIKGPNLERMYINSLDYVDTRPIKESLILSNGKSYKVVKETNKLRTGSNDVNTFTVKSVNDVFEYDIATYENVEDIKLIPGNNNQVIIAVKDVDKSTKVGVINTDDDSDVNSNGEVVSKVVDAGKIEGTDGAILNIDIENIKVNSDGKLSVTTTNNSTPIEVSVNNVEAGTPVGVIKEDPVIEKQTLDFNRKNPQDLVIKNIDFKGLSLTSLAIGGEIIDINELEITNNSIKIPKEIFASLKLDNGYYHMALGFENGSLFVGYVSVEITGISIDSTPTIEKQNLSFDRNNPKDMVIKNVDFKGLKLKSLSIGGKHIDINTLTTTDNSIIIPKEFFINLPLNNGKYYVIMQFENGSPSVGDVIVDITGETIPTIEKQTLSFNRKNPKDMVIKNVDFKGLSLKYIYINGNSIPFSSLKVEDDKVIIPANVLQSLGLMKGTYDISFKFLNDTTLLSAVDLNVIDTIEEEKPEEKPPVEEEKPEEEPEEKPPVEEEKPEERPEVIPPVENSQIVNVDNGEEIVFDVNKPTNIKIISSKLENKDIEYILVNGIKVTKTTIEGKLARNNSTYSTKEYFTVSNGSITLSSKLFEDLNFDIEEGYNIGVGFADGSKITDLAKLSIVDSSIDNSVTSPVEDNENNSNSGNTSNNGNTSNDVSNSTTNNTEVNKSEVNKSPNTGDQKTSVVALGLGMLSSLMGIVLLNRKKNN